MKTKRSQKSKKALLIVSFILIVIAVGSGIALYAIKNTNDSNQDPQTVNPDTQPDQVTDDKNDNPDTLPDKNDGKQTPSKPSDDKELEEDTTLEKPVITRASVSGGNLKSLATFQTTKSGNCTYEFSNEQGDIVSYQSSIVVGPSYYYCSLSADVSDFSKSSSWMLVVKHVTTTGYSVSAQKEVIIP